MVHASSIIVLPRARVHCTLLAPAITYCKKASAVFAPSVINPLHQTLTLRNGSFLAMSSDVLWPTSRGRASCGVRCRDSRAAVARLSTYSLSPRSPSISLKKRRQVRPAVAESSTGQSHRTYGQAPKLYHPKGTGVTAAMTLAGEGIREADRTLQRALDKSNTKFLTSSMSATQWISGHGCAVLLGGVAHEAQQERVGDDTPRHHRQQTLPAPPRLAQARATRTNTLHLLQNS